MVPYIPQTKYALALPWLPDRNLHECNTLTEILPIFSIVTIICYYMS